MVHITSFFKENHKVAIGFSGGVDSSYLLHAGLSSGADMMAYYVKSDFQPSFELDDAKRLAELIGAKLQILTVDVLNFEQVISNPPDRCYHCKNVIFSTIIKQANTDGYTLVIDGTNASDDASDRPGMRALDQLGVRSPLREYGITKDDIRLWSKAANLFTWNKPAYACLATRIPTGDVITKSLLYRVENSEDGLFSLGFSDFRVRVYHDAARIQFPLNQMPMALEKREQIIKKIKPYFDIILLDLIGR